MNGKNPDERQISEEIFLTKDYDETNPALRLDTMGFGDLKILQDPLEFCYGIDAVLLADFAAREKFAMRKVCELGAGNGAVSMIFNHKHPAEEILAVEIQYSAAQLAWYNMRRNALPHIEVIHSDILDLAETYYGQFDGVLTNPPYFPNQEALSSMGEAKRVARQESTASLKEFLEISSRLLKPGKSLYMVHRPFRLADIISLGRHWRLETKVMRLVAPAQGKAPNLVLLKLVKGGGVQMTVENTLYVRDKNGDYTEEINKIYQRI